MLKNTGAICMVTISDNNRESGIRHVDIGNFFTDEKGSKCVVTTRELANKYRHLIDCDIYTLKTMV